MPILSIVALCHRQLQIILFHFAEPFFDLIVAVEIAIAYEKNGYVSLLLAPNYGR